MTFTTITFLIFFTLFFMGYWWLAKRGTTLQNAFILLGSYLFYGWWDWRFLGLLFFSSTVDFIAGQLIYSSTGNFQRRLVLSVSIIINLSVLGFFKYYDFFVHSANDLMRVFGYVGSLKTLEIILPVGISFYTFQSISYGIDVYNRRLKPTNNLINFLAYVSFFPQLVAGPIERAAHLLPQFTVPKQFSYHNAVSGLQLMLWGFFKKMVIADNAAVVSDRFFANPIEYDTGSSWLALLCFALQIYGDFSGYSDIARGCARTLGFDLMINFKTPYFSNTFTEFWQRWHISLSTWFRDYVFIPLGGNKKGFGRYLINIMVTFILSGFWHGAKYTFLIWGALHGTLLIIEKLIFRKFPKWRWTPIIVFTVVVVCWVPFRAMDFNSTILIFKNLFIIKVEPTFDLVINYPRFVAWLLVLFIFMVVEYLIRSKSFDEMLNGMKRAFRWGIYYFLMAMIILFSNFNNAPSFIYFQF